MKTIDLMKIFKDPIRELKLMDFHRRVIFLRIHFRFDIAFKTKIMEKLQARQGIDVIFPVNSLIIKRLDVFLFLRRER